MQLLIEAIGFGIAAGAVIALGAVGFSVQFGMSNILNITYGSLMTLGAYTGLFLIDRGTSPWVALAVAGGVIGLVSIGFHRWLLAPLVRRGTRAFAIVIVTVSAGVVLQYIIVIFAGPDAKSYGEESGQTFHLGDLVMTASQVTIILLTTVLMLALHLLLTRTTLGRAMRATASNRILAQSCGIDTDRISDIAWLLSGILCGAAGVALAITTVSFDFSLGPVFLIPMIAAAVLGGIGQPYGAMLGGLVVGIASELAAAYTNPAYREVVAFAILIAMLLFRPRGLFGAAWATRRLMA
jgi:branched-subunit amino acid ABC-type transport system permease component